MQVKVTDPQQVAKIAEILGQTIGEGATLTITAPKNQVGRQCECGCGGTTSGGYWMPGHDARRKSRLYAAIRSGNPEQIKIATEELTRREWPMPSTRKGTNAQPLEIPTTEAKVTDSKAKAS